MLLLQVPRTRNDCEGIENADLEACSHAKYRKFCNSLNSRQYSALIIFRSGAISTPTRRHRHDDEHDSATSCSHCGFPHASARSRFEGIRSQLQAAYSIPRGCWRAQPRCTTKSAWVTIHAGRSPAQRVDRLIACAKLGIAITLAQEPLVE